MTTDGSFSPGGALRRSQWPRYGNSKLTTSNRFACRTRSKACRNSGTVTRSRSKLCVDATDPSCSRNYCKSDLEIVAGLAAASGFNAITVFALCVSSDVVRTLCRQLLWSFYPILMYWIARALLMAHRRMMDDPIAFALRIGIVFSWRFLLLGSSSQQPPRFKETAHQPAAIENRSTMGSDLKDMQ